MNKKNKSNKWHILITLIASFALLGMIWQFTMVQIERNTYVTIGEYADVGDHQAHYYTKGDGDRAFVFIAGSGTPCAYTDFYKLQNMLSNFGQTITFDHAGSGWSESTKAARTIKNLVGDLSDLIDIVAPNKSIVLICHSLGSLETIGYTQMYPEKVSGIIFLDSGSPQFYSMDSEGVAKILNRSAALARTLGINRTLGEMGIFLPIYGQNIRNRQLPGDVKEIDKAMYYQFAGNASSLKAIQLINENAHQILAGKTLGDTPVLVLSSDSGNQWNDVQKQLASWSKNSKQVRIIGSEHYLYWSNYDEVEHYIMEFIESSLK